MTKNAAPNPCTDDPTTARRRGRPRADPAQSQTRQRLIRTGLIYLTERGYGASGVDDILKDAGVPKGSFYHHFGSKEAFGAALIDAYHAYFVQKLDRSFQADLPALDRLRAFASDAEAGMARHGFTRGCLVGNLGQEMATLPDAFRARLVAVLEDWQTRTAQVLRLAVTQGTLPPDTDTDALAVLFWTGWEGAVLRAKMERGPAPLRGFSEIFLTLIT